MDGKIMAGTMKKSAKVFLLSISLVNVNVESGYAADCRQTCVEVRREGGELVISAHRDPIRRKVSPGISPTPSPSHRAQSAPRAKRRKASSSLSDQIRELLPNGSFTLLPTAGALVHEPLLLHTHGCADFAKTLPILDTEISLTLDPVIHWSWGDGTEEYWRGNAVRGAHIFHRPGRYRIELRCQWRGWFRTPNSQWLRVPEGITSVHGQTVAISRAHIFFTE